MEQEYQRPEIAVGVMIFKNGKVLLGKRRNTSTHGWGEYSFPGGRLEHMESFEEAVKRETFEEAGIKIKDIKFQCLVNVGAYKPKHIILIGFVANWESGEPRSFEDERIGDWDWCNINNLPKPIFPPTNFLVKSYESGENYFDF